MSWHAPATLERSQCLPPRGPADVPRHGGTQTCSPLRHENACDHLEPSAQALKRSRHADSAGRASQSGRRCVHQSWWRSTGGITLLCQREMTRHRKPQHVLGAWEVKAQAHSVTAHPLLGVKWAVSGWPGCSAWGGPLGWRIFHSMVDPNASVPPAATTRRMSQIRRAAVLTKFSRSRRDPPNGRNTHSPRVCTCHNRGCC